MNRAAAAVLSAAIFLLLVQSLSAGAQPVAGSGSARAAFGWLRDLAGACWRGQQAHGKPACQVTRQRREAGNGVDSLVVVYRRVR